MQFVQDILAAARRHGLTRGLYIGCGNGRNLVPLLTGGLDLLGPDVSSKAIAQLRGRRPDRTDQLIVGDLSALPAAARYELVIGIQVFQHGTRYQAHQHLPPLLRASRPRAALRPSQLNRLRYQPQPPPIRGQHRR